MVTDGNQIYCGDHFVMYRNLESVYAPVTNDVLQVIYTLVEKKKKKTQWKSRKKEENLKSFGLPQWSSD